MHVPVVPALASCTLTHLALYICTPGHLGRTCTLRLLHVHLGNLGTSFFGSFCALASLCTRTPVLHRCALNLASRLTTLSALRRAYSLACWFLPGCVPPGLLYQVIRTKQLDSSAPDAPAKMTQPAGIKVWMAKSRGMRFATFQVRVGCQSMRLGSGVLGGGACSRSCLCCMLLCGMQVRLRLHHVVCFE